MKTTFQTQYLKPLRGLFTFFFLRLIITLNIHLIYYVSLNFVKVLLYMLYPL